MRKFENSFVVIRIFSSKIKPYNVYDLEFKDYVESTKTWVYYLENKEKLDAFVVLTHLGS